MKFNCWRLKFNWWVYQVNFFCRLHGCKQILRLETYCFLSSPALDAFDKTRCTIYLQLSALERPHIVVINMNSILTNSGKKHCIWNCSSYFLQPMPVNPLATSRMINIHCMRSTALSGCFGYKHAKREEMRLYIYQ